MKLDPIKRVSSGATMGYILTDPKTLSMVGTTKVLTNQFVESLLEGRAFTTPSPDHAHAPPPSITS